MTGIASHPVHQPPSATRILRNLGVALSLALAVPPLLPTTALAQHHGGGHHGGGHHYGGHGGGWHWGVGIGLGAPYYLGRPYGWDSPYGVYDYPPPVTYVYPPPVTVLQQPAPAPVQAGYWYYCDNPRGYYPYVQTCGSAWRPVPVTPTSPPP